MTNKLFLTLFLVAFWMASNFCSLNRSLGADTQQEKLNSALAKAVETNRVREVRALLRKGASANARDKEGDAVLKEGARYASLSVIRMLLWRGADVNAQTGTYGGTALIFAAERGDIAIVKLLLKWGADANAHDGEDWTASQSAMDNGHRAVAKLLKRAEAKGNVTRSRLSNKRLTRQTAAL